MNEGLADEFHIEMLDVYERAKRECRYDAKLFKMMVHSMRGLPCGEEASHCTARPVGL